MKARAALFIPLKDFLQVWRRVLILELRPDGSLAEGENENLVSDGFFFLGGTKFESALRRDVAAFAPNSPRRKVFRGLSKSERAGEAFALRLPQGVKPDKD